jgi:hypothetical protein
MIVDTELEGIRKEAVVTQCQVRYLHLLGRILESNIIGKRPVGKPSKRWVNAVEIDIRDILKTRKCKGEYIERQACRRHLKETKVRFRAIAPWNKKKKKK